MYSVGISPSPMFTKEMIPNYLEMEKTDDFPEKACILCKKKNMDLDGLHFHLERTHDLTWGIDDGEDSTYEEWVEAFNKATEYDPDNATSEDEDIQQSSDSSSESSNESSSSERPGGGENTKELLPNQSQ